MGSVDITVKNLSKIFREKIIELQEEPEFRWRLKDVRYSTNEGGSPLVKLSIANVPINYDLWKNLRNPAVIGLHPAGLKEIWDFYANRRKRKIDESGRQTIFQIPRSFSSAQKIYHRVLIVSFMLPFSNQIVNEYAMKIVEEGRSSSHLFSKMLENVNLMIDKATSRVGIDIVGLDNVVVPMHGENVKAVSSEAIPAIHQGVSHGPSKGGNYPQKSIAVLTGLGQFGVSRFVFRDEYINGKVQRFVGPLRSIIIFDKEYPVKDKGSDLIYLSDSWRSFLFKLFNFTNIDSEVNKYRFCTYISDGNKGCAECRRCCPSGAQPNSMPMSNGKYPEQVLRQKHRFWDNQLQFDFGKCCDERGHMQSLFPDWSCARCVTVCASKGLKRIYAAKNFYQKMIELAC